MSSDFATQVVRTLVDAGFIAYWAGGCVRDLLRGEIPHDYDVATNATPEQVRNLFGAKRTLAVGESFGVVVVLGAKGSGESIEVATFRKEGEYLDGRHPSTVEFCTAEGDASRRDFTINGMFFDPMTRQVHDFVGGQEDLKRRIVRAIGEPLDRMTEDKLRMLRAVRFAAKFEFSLDPQTASAVVSMADQIRMVSAERISQEFRKMLVDRSRATAMELCQQLGLLRVVLPEVEQKSCPSPARWSQILQHLDQLKTVSFEAAMAALLRDVPAPLDHSTRDAVTSGTVRRVCRRFKLSNDETNRIAWLSENKAAFSGLDSAPPHRVKRLVVEPGFPELLQLERTLAQLKNEDLTTFAWLDAYLKSTPPNEIHPVPLLTGNDLLELGYRSGPQFKEWLFRVRNAQLDQQILTKDQAIALVRDLAANPESTTDSQTGPDRGDQV
ncbi:CCA tRNA nucleotidyltransferase [Planctomicrobium sp. SH668]|uniref:CCA tRNA nucleotidyltransferase n=1 Tax=Planctomicrobium sp. SH668 TaxID=3448126 RepID=UPI003F5C74C7